MTTHSDNVSLTDHSAGISDTPGFATAASACDIRQKGDHNRLDLALIHSSTPLAAAGVFTLNDICAAPVKVCRQLLDQSHTTFHGVVVNSGNANACTGDQGLCDAVEMGHIAEDACKAPKNSFFVCSTGRIGTALPMDSLRQGIHSAAKNLNHSETNSRAAAEAILTSDTRPKTVTARFSYNGQTVTVAGMAKGAGMIEPNMATMLAFITTDALIAPALLQQILTTANQTSFNRITVDGDMSTNDTVLLLANGTSGVAIEETDAAALDLFRTSVNAVCRNLAAKIVGDGEKITKVVRIRICGARTEADAEAIARAIGNSLLVKTSWYGNDPNWGRLMDAAGYARTGLSEEKIDLFYDDVPVLKAGNPLWDNKARWKTIVSERHFGITLNLNLGTAETELLAADLSEAYVEFNKSE